MKKEKKLTLLRFIVYSISCENAIQLWWSFQNPCFCLLLPGSELSLLASSRVYATSLPSQTKTTHRLINVLHYLILWFESCCAAYAAIIIVTELTTAFVALNALS